MFDFEEIFFSAPNEFDSYSNLVDGISHVDLSTHEYFSCGHTFACTATTRTRRKMINLRVLSFAQSMHRWEMILFEITFYLHTI